MRLTNRGWFALTVAASIVAAVLGFTTAAGDNPCEYAVTTLECGK